MIFNCIEQVKLFWDLENKNIFSMEAPLLQTLVLKFFLIDVPILGPDWISQGSITSPAAPSSCSSQAGAWDTALASLPSVLFWGWERVEWAGVSCEMGKGQEHVHLHLFQLFAVAQWEVRSYLELAPHSASIRILSAVGSAVFNCTVCAFWRFNPYEKLWLGRAF